MTEEELKHRHAIRVHRNKKHKQHDRFKGLPFEYIPIRYGCWRHMPSEKDWQFNRRKTPTETGFGVAYEHRPSCEVK